MAPSLDYSPLTLASASDTPFSELIELAHHPDPMVRQAVARNPAALRRGDEYAFSILIDLASHFPDDVLANPGLSRALAGRDAETEEILSRVASHTQNEEILRGLLARPNPGPWLRCSLARNSLTPAEFLPRFAADPDRLVRLQIAFRADTPAGLLRKLASDLDREVRRHVAMHKNSPADVLETLARDPERRVSDMVLYRELTGQEAPKKTPKKRSPQGAAAAKAPAKKAAKAPAKKATTAPSKKAAKAPAKRAAGGGGPARRRG